MLDDKASQKRQSQTYPLLTVLLRPVLDKELRQILWFYFWFFPQRSVIVFFDHYSPS